MKIAIVARLLAKRDMNVNTAHVVIKWPCHVWAGSWQCLLL